MKKLSYTGMAVDLLEMSRKWIIWATDDLTDEQLYYQPSSETNSIAWLAWHMSRWQDMYASLASEEPEVWVSEGWAEKFGMEHDRTGLGDTAEQVAAFRVDRKLIFGYVDAALEAAIERVGRMTTEQLESKMLYMPYQDTVPSSRALMAVVMDTTQHTGQISYLRGLITGKGWMPA